MTGKAYLVGAGPGRADLITVRGLRLLRNADVVLYDRLIARELLDEAPSGAEMIFVGKREGHHLMPQEEINQLIALLEKKEREHQQVVMQYNHIVESLNSPQNKMLSALVSTVPTPGVVQEATFRFKKTEPKELT